jgi:putative transposase
VVYPLELNGPKPTDNGFIEAFNSKFLSECLNPHWFMNLADAREAFQDWRRDYNEVQFQVLGCHALVNMHNVGGVTSP